MNPPQNLSNSQQQINWWVGVWGVWFNIKKKKKREERSWSFRWNDPTVWDTVETTSIWQCFPFSTNVSNHVATSSFSVYAVEDQGASVPEWKAAGWVGHLLSGSNTSRHRHSYCAVFILLLVNASVQQPWMYQRRGRFSQQTCWKSSGVTYNFNASSVVLRVWRWGGMRPHHYPETKVAERNSTIIILYTHAFPTVEILLCKTLNVFVITTTQIPNIYFTTSLIFLLNRLGPRENSLSLFLSHYHIKSISPYGIFQRARVLQVKLPSSTLIRSGAEHK